LLPYGFIPVIFIIFLLHKKSVRKFDLFCEIWRGFCPNKKAGKSVESFTGIVFWWWGIKGSSLGPTD